MQSWTRLLIENRATIEQACRLLDELHTEFLVAVDSSGRLVGVIEDLTIREAMLSGLSLQAPVATVATTPAAVEHFSSEAGCASRAIGSIGDDYLVRVNSDHKVVDVQESAPDLGTDRRLNTIVLMVGGSGIRLHPLTERCPKPLLPIQGKPLLERTIEDLARQGFHKIILTVSYKAEMIASHFGNGSKWGVEISYIQEPQPLGTCGALSLISQLPNQPMVVVNGDLITELRLSHLLSFHRRTSARATVGVQMYPMQVPYGVVEYSGSHLTSIREKPTLSPWINAGIYVLDPSVLELIPPGDPFDMPALLQIIMDTGDTISVFPLREQWLDIGSLAEYERANQVLELKRSAPLAHVQMSKLVSIEQRS